MSTENKSTEPAKEQKPVETPKVDEKATKAEQKTEQKIESPVSEDTKKASDVLTESEKTTETVDSFAKAEENDVVDSKGSPLESNSYTK